MTVTSVAVAITKFLFGTCDCTVDSAVVPAILRSCLGFYTCMMDTRKCNRTCLALLCSVLLRLNKIS